ncbi:shikimate dehydrogenase [Bacillus sp. HMF5848]|uniref:shikimate dehydrogenase n=1 Tax=Bacillus sp. HMF5848 TaxID=2495421 RepID=UPI000F79764B|nr:shikimate dehydrogenase [Bacillus sp. HMF5848]RSK27923.1 shikimate dehydrogenase [Bacillus sp. HMF5848]
MKKLYGVIGAPIAHSLSPVMHNDMFQALHIDAYYHAFKVEKHKLASAVEGLKALNVAGFNVTIPHKVAILPLLDEVDEVAQQIGAVNTVVNDAGRLIGYNTDGQGFFVGLRNLDTQILSKKILIIGAGGAARAIYITFAHLGATSIDICNRTIDNAREIIDSDSHRILSKALTIQEAEVALEQYDVIINTTSVGMHPNIDASPLSLHNLKLPSIVSDIIYNPFQTKLLREAKERGATVQNGIPMFIQQGALAFEKWTGHKPDTDRMAQVVIRALGGK